MPLVGFEPTVSAGERPQTYVLDRAATGTGLSDKYHPSIHVGSFTVLMCPTQSNAHMGGGMEARSDN